MDGFAGTTGNELKYLVRFLTDKRGATEAEQVVAKVNSAVQLGLTGNTKALEAAGIKFRDYTKTVEGSKVPMRDLIIPLTSVNKNLGNAVGTLEMTKKGFKEVGVEIPKVTQQHGRLSGALRNVSTDMSNLLRRAAMVIPVWLVLRTAVMGVIRAISSTIKSMREVEYAMAEIKAVSDWTAESYKNLEKRLVSLAVKFGEQAVEVVKGAKLWVQQGKSMAETAKLTETALYGVILTGQSTETVVENLTAAMKIYDVSIEDSISIVDKWINVSRRHAITTADLANGLKRVGPIAKEFGVDLDEINGYLTAMVAVTRRTGTEIGTVLRTVFARIVSQGGRALQTLAKIPIYLDESGKATFEASSRYRDMSDVFDELSYKWDSLSDAQKKHIAVQMAGVRRSAEFLALMQNYAEALDARRDSLVAAGTAEKRAQEITTTLHREIARLNATLQEFGDILAQRGMLEPLKNWTAALQRLIEQAENLASLDVHAIESVLAIIGGGGAALAGMMFGHPVAGVVAAAIIAIVQALDVYGAKVRETREELERLRQEEKKTIDAQIAKLESFSGLVNMYGSALKYSKDYSSAQRELEKTLLAISDVNPELAAQLVQMGSEQERYNLLLKEQKRSLEEIAELELERRAITVKPEWRDELLKLETEFAGLVERVRERLAASEVIGALFDSTGKAREEIEKVLELIQTTPIEILPSLEPLIKGNKYLARYRDILLEILKTRKVIFKLQENINQATDEERERLRKLKQEHAERIEKFKTLVQLREEYEKRSLAIQGANTRMLMHVDALNLSITEKIDAQIEAQKALLAEAEKYLENIGEGGEGYEAQARAVERIKEQIETLEFQKYIVEPLKEAMKFAEGLQDTFSEAFADIFKGEATFKDFIDRITEYWRDTIADTFAKGLSEQLFQVTGLGGIFGDMMFNIAHVFEGPAGKIKSAGDYHAITVAKYIRGAADYHGAVVAASVGAGTAVTPELAGRFLTEQWGATAVQLPSSMSSADITRWFGQIGVLSNFMSWMGRQKPSYAGGGGGIPGYASAMVGVPIGAYGAMPMTFGGSMLPSNPYIWSGGRLLQRRRAGQIGPAYEPAGAGAYIGAGMNILTAGLTGYMGAGGGALGGIAGGMGMAGAIGGLMPETAMGAAAPWLMLGSMLLGMFGRMGKETSVEERKNTLQVTSKIDTTNKKLDVVNRNLIALKNTMETYILPETSYLAEKVNIEDQFSLHKRRGV